MVEINSLSHLTIYITGLDEGFLNIFSSFSSKEYNNPCLYSLSKSSGI